MVGQTAMGKYRYYRCRRAYAGRRHDRCPTRYVRASDLEGAVVRELTTVLASPEMVLAELERASSSDARNDDRAAAQQLLAPLRGYEVESASAAVYDRLLVAAAP